MRSIACSANTALVVTMPNDMVDVDTLGDRTIDDLVRHRCICRAQTVLGAHGWENGQYVYKVIWRDRALTVYFGVFVIACRDCKRRHRVRMLPKKSAVDLRVLRDKPQTEMAH